MGKFPWFEILNTIHWQEILVNTVGIISGYFAGRYRVVSKNQNRRSDDPK